MAEFIFKVGVGTRANEASAAAAVQYIIDESDSEISNVFYANIPEFAQDNPPTFFEAVDARERKNGVLFRSMMCGIPRELDEKQAVELVKNFVDEVTGGAGFPAAIAFHDLGGSNPHAHVVFSERATLLNGVSRDELDGVVRDAKGFFKRADSNNPANGGVPKAMIGKNDEERREWLKHKRQLWQDFSNNALEAAGFDERISCKSLIDQGIYDRDTQKKKFWMTGGYEKMVAKLSGVSIDIVRSETKDHNGITMLSSQLSQQASGHKNKIKAAMLEVEQTRPKLVSAIRWHETREHVEWLKRRKKRLKLKAQKELELAMPPVVHQEDRLRREGLEGKSHIVRYIKENGKFGIRVHGDLKRKDFEIRGKKGWVSRVLPEGMRGIDIPPTKEPLKNLTPSRHKKPDIDAGVKPKPGKPAQATPIYEHEDFLIIDTRKFNDATKKHERDFISTTPRLFIVDDGRGEIHLQGRGGVREGDFIFMEEDKKIKVRATDRVIDLDTDSGVTKANAPAPVKKLDTSTTELKEEKKEEKKKEAGASVVDAPKTPTKSIGIGD